MAQLTRKSAQTQAPRPGGTTPPRAVGTVPIPKLGKGAQTKPAQPKPPDAVAMPRTMTVEDPMTTQLLAEVARRSETLDFDDAVIDRAVESLDKPAAKTATAEHPHTLRRRKR